MNEYIQRLKQIFEEIKEDTDLYTETMVEIFDEAKMLADQYADEQREFLKSCINR